MIMKKAEAKAKAKAKEYLFHPGVSGR